MFLEVQIPKYLFFNIVKNHQSPNILESKICNGHTCTSKGPNKKIPGGKNHKKCMQG